MIRRPKKASATRESAAPAVVITPWLRNKKDGCSVARFIPEQSIFRQGEPCGEIFYIHAGTAWRAHCCSFLP